MQIILFPLVPAMILYAAHLEEEVQAKLLKEVYELLKSNGSTKKLMEKLDESKTYLKKLKTHLLSIKLNEVVETNVQLVLQSVMFALFAFSVLFGFVGLLVAVPVAAAVGVLVRFAIDRYLTSDLYWDGIEHHSDEPMPVKEEEG